MLVLGLNFGGHDPAAAIVRDGEVLAAAEQERFSRRKRAFEQMPVDAVRACLAAADIEPEAIDGIAVGWDVPRLRLPLPELPVFNVANALPPEFAAPTLRRQVMYVPHHLAHAASAFLCSGFGEAAALVMDGEGEAESTSLAHATADGISVLRTFPISRSLGHFYRAATQYGGVAARSAGSQAVASPRPSATGEEGFRAGAEGKLMGLAAYGHPLQPMPLYVGEDGPDLLAEVKPARETGERHELRSNLRRWWEAHCFPYTVGDGQEIMAYAHFAASAQRALEEAILALATELRSRSGTENLVVAGGVGLNCSANGRLVRSGLFKRYFFQPLAHDAGVAIGAALLVDAQGDPATRRWERRAATEMVHAFLGPEFPEAALETALRSAELRADRLDPEPLVRRVAADLAGGLVVGWFYGRAEVGPRALGARSILADPRSRRTVARVNGIKNREMWRPLAPSVLAEYFHEYFDCPFASPFMNVSATVRPDVRHRIPAVVHVDWSARPQVVARSSAPVYWRLIAAFRDLTGVPVVLNTSFNLEHEPIVNTPEEAIRSYQASDLDMLVLGNFVTYKPGRGRQ